MSRFIALLAMVITAIHKRIAHVDKIGFSYQLRTALKIILIYMVLLLGLVDIYLPTFGSRYDSFLVIWLCIYGLKDILAKYFPFTYLPTFDLQN